MENYNEYFTILKTAVDRNMPVKYFFIYQGNIYNAFDLIKKSSDDLYQKYSTIRFSLDKIHYHDICFLYYMVFGGESDEENNLTDDEIFDNILVFLTQIRAEIMFDNFNDFLSSYNTWRENYVNESKNASDIYNQEKIFYDYLSTNVSPSKLVNETLLRTTSSFTIEIVEESLELFNSLKVSKKVPFIQRVDQKLESSLKFYLPQDQFENLDYSYLKPVIKPSSNHIYFYILINPKKIIEGSYILASLNLYTGVIEIPDHPYYIDDKLGKDFMENVIVEVFNALPDKPNEPRKPIYHEYTEYSSILDFENIDFREEVFYYLLMTDIYFKNFFTNEEKSSWASGDNKLKIDYKGFRILLRYITVKDSRTITASFNILGNIEDNRKTVLRIHVSKVYGNYEYRGFKEELSYILGYMNKRSDEISELFEKYIPSQTIIPQEQKIIKELYARKLDILNHKAPLIYKGRSKKIQCITQPIIIEERDKDDWENYLLPNDTKRMVIQFPPLPSNDEERQYYDQNKDIPRYYVCPDDKYAYPQIVLVADPTEDSLYPVAPKCNERYNVNTAEQKNIYQIRKEGAQQSQRIKENITKTLKTRKLGESGELPEEVKDFVSSLDSLRVFRHGSDLGPSSLICAIFQGLFEHNIDMLPWKSLSDFKRVSVDSREAYYNKLRQILSERPHLFKQEMFDDSLEEISNKIKNPHYFLESHLHYHGFEEYFKVNIFTIVLDKKTYYFEIPRSANMNIRNLPSRPSILLFRNVHTNVVSYDFIGYFTDDRIIEAYRESTIFYVWDQQNSKKIARISPYDYPAGNNLSWTEILKDNKSEFVSQFIDAYGKVRIFNMRNGNDDFSIYCLPTQPLDLPVDRNPHLIDADKILKIISTRPSKISKSGFFYDIFDFKDTIYVPVAISNIEELSRKLKIPITDKTSPFTPDVEHSEYTIYRKKKKTVGILLDCIRWCWRNDIEGLSAEEWVEKYIKAERDEDDIETIDEIPIIFPVLTQQEICTPSAIQSISSWWKNDIFVDESINLYPDLIERLKVYLITEERKTESLYRIPPERYVLSQIQNEFLLSENSATLFGTNTYREYISSLQHKNAAEIKTYVEQDDIFPQLCKVITDDKQFIYIVQPTKRGTLSECLYTCSYWKLYNINLVDNEIELDPEGEVYGIYGQDENMIIPIEDKTKGSLDYSEVLYLSGLYFSMIRIL
jgi:hypothetical protein